MLGTLKRHRKATILVATLATMTLAGTAFAYWTGQGSGSGTAKNAATVADIVVSQTASLGLTPGNSVPLLGSLTNPNNTDVKVGTLTATITGVDGGAAVADFSLAGSALVNAVVKKGAPISWSGLTLAYANSAVNQDNGKSATVSIAYTLTPFVENALPPLGTFRVLTVNGVRTFDIYVHTVVSSYPTTIQAGDTLSTYDMGATFGTPAWVDNLATADASGNLRYTAPFPTTGHSYQITVKRAGSSLDSFTVRLS